MENTTSLNTGAAPIPQSRAATDADVYRVAAGFIAYWEGFIANAKWDVNAYRCGFGSDTEGPDQIPVKQGTITTRDRALQNLAARIPQYAATCIKQVGAGLWAQFGTPTKVACLDLAYNYGDIPAHVLGALTTNPVQAANAIRSLARDNGGINHDRREAEAGLVIFDGGQIQ
jgi:GH24 family phage-related lysozyme (muramidase)